MKPGCPKGPRRATIILRERVLQAVVSEARRNIDRDPEVGRQIRLELIGHRRAFGALTMRIKTRLPDYSYHQVVARLRELEEQGLIGAWKPHESSVRWFPVSLIPKS